MLKIHDYRKTLQKYREEPDETAVMIPEGVQRIGQDAFQFARNLEAVHIPETVTFIGDGAFYGCENLAEISIPASVAVIGENAFTRTKWLAEYPQTFNIAGAGILVNVRECGESLLIPEGVCTIAPLALQNCEHAECVTLPASLQTCRITDFDRFRELKKLTFCFANGNRYTLDWEKYRSYYSSRISHALKMLIGAERDFRSYYWPKQKILAEYAYYSEDSAICQYIRTDIYDFVRTMIERNCMDTLQKLLKPEYFTRKKLEKLLDFALDWAQKPEGSAEPQVLLMHFKAEYFGFEDIDERLRL